jgi:hypothetical protein
MELSPRDRSIPIAELAICRPKVSVFEDRWGSRFELAEESATIGAEVLRPREARSGITLRRRCLRNRRKTDSY